MPTFRKFAERHLGEDVDAKLKLRTVVNYRICLTKHAAPMIGGLKVPGTIDDRKPNAKISQIPANYHRPICRGGIAALNSDWGLKRVSKYDSLVGEIPTKILSTSSDDMRVRINRFQKRRSHE